MKFLYRLSILIIIAALTFYLIKFPIKTGIETIKSFENNPVRKATQTAEGDRFFRQLLNDKQKILYDEIYNSITNGEDKAVVKVYDIVENDIILSMDYIMYDNPEIFWVNFLDINYVVSNSGTEIEIDNIYSESEIKNMKEELDTVVADIISQMKSENITDEYDKASYLHDYLVGICDYDLTGTAKNAHNAYGSLVERTAVCDGYVHGYRLLLDAAEIESCFVVGEVAGQKGITPHAWSLVNFSGVFTFVDPTWNDIESHVISEIPQAKKIVSHAFFGMSDIEISKTHKIDENIADVIPQAKSNDWFVKNGYSAAKLDDFVENAAEALAKRASEGGEYTYFELSLTDQTEFRDFVEGIGGGVSNLIDKANEFLLNEETDIKINKEIYYFITNAEKGAVLIILSLSNG
ncbi:MAG: hypothetical protein GX222_00275 [Ruminococcaceae bacterium]|nr:hypothetical protein [Oscillospiraceae bacterium]